ncbi:hypothetical protein [Spiroplasma endosymbiont of Seladonia tumulorum]|uniref:hypothetical protein n=1 Tax=Spiroplasma endosymbiont of Seladonia tumulorum TaxID=3066321 RepID=UPI0030D052CE
MFTEFINEFNNFNRSLGIKYSNYYHTTKPLVLSENDSSFNLTNINFDNIAKFIPLSSKNVLALTVKFNIMYEVKFKELQVRDSISGLIVVSNDLVAVNHMQADLKDYFITFIDILFAKQNYSMVDRHNSDFNDVANVPDAVWNIIRTELNRLNITFFSKVVPYGNLPSLYKLTDNISKQYASVLLWAGEGYSQIN